MRTSNRLRERCTSALLAVASIAATMAAGASCTNDDDVVLGQETDASANEDASDGSANAETDADADADAPRSPIRDAATSDAAPEPVVCASSPCAVSLVATRDDTFCVLLEDKTVACWGANGVSTTRTLDLGRGPTMTEDSAVPERVEGLTNIRYLDRGCAVDGAGDTWCWGTGPYLRSTTKAFTTEGLPVKLPIPPATRVSIGFYRLGVAKDQYAVGCATVDSGLICWGTNGMGHLGPQPLEGSTTVPHDPRPITVPPGAPIQSLAVGRAAFALRTDGTALSWGENPPLARVSSLFPDPYPRPTVLDGVSRLDVFHENACAVAHGIAYCWGSNPNGNGVEPLKFVLPRAVAMPEPVVDIATHSNVVNPKIQQRGCAVGLSGALYCWGDNQYGQVGDGTREFAMQPVKIDLPARVSQVKTTKLSTCALLTTGKVHCWGDNRYGQLGNGDILVSSTVPQEVLLP